MIKRTLFLLSLCWCLSASLFAAQITGTVTNGTTNKPAAGDDVVLLSLSGGMQETARTRTDNAGHFVLNATDEGVQHLIRVTHQGVNYHHAAPQGTTTAAITVYDSAKQVDNIIAEGHVFNFQTTAGQLEVKESNVLRNESRPPRTRMSERSFEVVLPERAKVEDGMAAGPGGMPVTSSPVPTGEKNHWAFVFPIRPGKTEFQITYKLPYLGTREFTVAPDTSLAELGVMLPKTMKFAAPGDLFAKAQDVGGMDVYVAKSVAAKQQVKFTVTGEGTAPAEPQGETGGQVSGPGGGMAPPSNAPTPMSGSTWAVLGILAVGMAGGVWWLLRSRLPGPVAETAQKSPAVGPPPATGGRRATSDMLDALKEELFQLESDRVLDKISQQEYDTAKAGLQALIRRNMKKN